MTSGGSTTIIEGSPYDPEGQQHVLVNTKFQATSRLSKSYSRIGKGEANFVLMPAHYETATQTILAGCREYKISMRIINGKIVNHWTTLPKININNKVTSDQKITSSGSATGGIFAANVCNQKSKGAEAVFESPLDLANPVVLPDMVRWFPRYPEVEISIKHPFWIGNHEFGIEFECALGKSKVRMHATATDVRFASVDGSCLSKIQSMALRIKHKSLRGNIQREEVV